MAQLIVSGWHAGGSLFSPQHFKPGLWHRPVIPALRRQKNPKFKAIQETGSVRRSRPLLEPKFCHSVTLGELPPLQNCGHEKAVMLSVGREHVRPSVSAGVRWHALCAKP